MFRLPAGVRRPAGRFVLSPDTPGGRSPRGAQHPRPTCPRAPSDRGASNQGPVYRDAARACRAGQPRTVCRRRSRARASRGCEALIAAAPGPRASAGVPPRHAGSDRRPPPAQVPPRPGMRVGQRTARSAAQPCERRRAQLPQARAWPPLLSCRQMSKNMDAGAKPVAQPSSPMAQAEPRASRGCAGRGRGPNRALHLPAVGQSPAELRALSAGGAAPAGAASVGTRRSSPLASPPAPRAATVRARTAPRRPARIAVPMDRVSGAAPHRRPRHPRPPLPRAFRRGRQSPSPLSQG
eukprot:scaffold20819_cov108-Isochrysis_galbana.AAC.5